MFLQYEVTNLPATDDRPWVNYVTRTIYIQGRTDPERVEAVNGILQEARNEFPPEATITPLRIIKY